MATDKLLPFCFTNSLMSCVNCCADFSKLVWLLFFTEVNTDIILPHSFMSLYLSSSSNPWNGASNSSNIQHSVYSILDLRDWFMLLLAIQSLRLARPSFIRLDNFVIFNWSIHLLFCYHSHY